MNTPLTFSIIGCGRVGITLAAFLSRAGYASAGFYSRTRTSALKAKAAAGQGEVFDSAVAAGRAASIVFISTPDLVIQPVCDQLAAEDGFEPNTIVFHLSGALSSDILSAARQAGARVGSIHPLQSFAPFDANQPSPFSGINMSIEGDEDAVATGRRIIKDLGASDFTIPTRAKTLYHAAAVVASNYLVTLEHFAVSLLGQADLSPEKAYEILEPLIWGTLNNIKSRGTLHALTGPVARGDTQVVSRHMTEIEDAMPEYASLYRLLGRYTLDIVRQRGEIDDPLIVELVALFAHPRVPS